MEYLPWISKKKIRHHRQIRMMDVKDSFVAHEKKLKSEFHEHTQLKTQHSPYSMTCFNTATVGRSCHVSKRTFHIKYCI